MRKTKLVDCNPQWVRWDSREPGPEFGPVDAIEFDCPEGHEHCSYTIPFTPALDGSQPTSVSNIKWQRSGEAFETFTLTPSIRGIPKYESRDAAIATLGEEAVRAYAHPRMWCAFHGFITNGEITFCGDSR